MKLHELLDRYNLLTKKQKILFLANLAAELTVSARDTYIAGTDEVADPQRLRIFNELQHRVSGHLRNLLIAAADQYPDDVICGIIFEGCRESKANAALRHALELLNQQTKKPVAAR